MGGESARADDEAKLATRIGAAAADAGLGQHQATYHAMVPRWNKIRIRLLIVLLVDGVISTGYFAGQMGPVIVLGGFIGAPLTATALIVTISALRHRRRYRGARLDLYQHGLIRTQGGRLGTVRYDTTTLLRKNSRTNRGGAAQRTYRYDLTDIVGQPLELTDAFLGQPQWAAAIDQAVTQAKLPQAMAALRAGQRLDFGEIWFSATEVGDRKRSAPWTQIKEVEVLLGEIVVVTTIGSKRDLANTVLSKVPDFPLFFVLAEQLRSSAPQHR